ncbi:MAG: DNA repair protein RadA [Chloroflexi bacterium]|nr:DNA repair protein RadA [Chloroflexota bacterium]
MVRSAENQRTVFACRDCGNETAKWSGFCPSPACGSALPLVEVKPALKAPSAASWNSTGRQPLEELSQLDPEDRPLISLPGQEINRVLGGGIVAGSVVLLTGEPGVGKSTLLLQIAGYLACQGKHVLYVTGEESPHQIKIRSQRLGITGEGIFILPESDVDTILEKLDECRPALVIVDSIQTLYCREVASGPGSVAQVRESGLRLMRWAKSSHTPVFLAGHVTKDGGVAGPRVLEHMVDVVTYLEAQDAGAYRILRNTKNRFGSTSEVGVFEMTGLGLTEVTDPSKAMLAQRYHEAVGAAVVPVLEGNRPLMLEVQALTSPSHGPTPRRVGNGVDYNRLLMLSAVASRRGGLDLAGQDIIVNVAGGFRISEPAADLPVVLAMASSLLNRALKNDLTVFGEVGLSGEVRPAPQAQRRVQEAARLGFSHCILPAANREQADPPPGMQLIYVGSVREAVQKALGDGISQVPPEIPPALRQETALAGV